jgi:hypothetical protein
VLIKQLLMKKLIFKIQDKQLTSLGTALKLQLLPGVLTWGNTPGMLMSVRSLVESSKHDLMLIKPLMGARDRRSQQAKHRKQPVR